MKSFRFLHTADIHLDSPLRGLTGQEGPAAARIRTATRRAWDQCVGRAIEEEVDFVIIAGDLYDGDWRDYNTGLFFVQQIARLRDAGIPVYLLYGNHDAESQITRRLTLPDTVHVFGSRRPQSYAIRDLDVVLHGQSFRQRDITDNLALNYPEPTPDTFNIGVLHTGLGGRGGHQNYAPCTLDDLIHKGYDYWALGHVHQAAILNERPHVVFPGNLQGRHIRETGSKGAVLVTVDGGEVVDVGPVASEVVSWAVVPVDLASTGSLGEVFDRMRDAIEEAVKGTAEGRLLACRIELRGRTGMHGDLLAADERLLAEARSSALALGEERAWVEKVVVATTPAADPELLKQRGDAVGELLSILGEARSDGELVEKLKADIGELVRRLPSEARSDIEDPLLGAAAGGEYGALMEALIPYLAARLTTEEG